MLALYAQNMAEQTPKAVDETQAFDLSRFHTNAVLVWPF